jgi:hypothetical protein
MAAQPSCAAQDTNKDDVYFTYSPLAQLVPTIVLLAHCVDQSVRSESTPPGHHMTATTLRRSKMRAGTISFSELSHV